MSRKKILIIGGQGQMGSLFLKYFQKSKDNHVDTLDKGEWENKASLIKDYHLVLISTPINITDDIIKLVAQYTGPETIMADLTSIKTRPLQTMMDYHSGPVLGMHPIFGPTIDKPNKQVIIHCHGRQRSKYLWVLEYLNHINFKLIELNAIRHDKIMDYIQGVEHFSTYCLGVFLEKEELDIQQLYDMASPIYKLELSILGRLFAQDAKLYQDIITHDKTRLAKIGDFVKSMNKEYQSLCKNKNEFEVKFKTVTSWMGSFAKNSQQKTDRIIKLK